MSKMRILAPIAGEPTKLVSSSLEYLGTARCEQSQRKMVEPIGIEPMT